MKLSTKNLPESAFAYDEFGEVVCEWSQVMDHHPVFAYSSLREQAERKMNEARTAAEAAKYLTLMLYIQHRANREEEVCV